jgi:hypothetical protein
MYSAKMLSDAIRLKRKKIKEDGVDNMVDTGPRPHMDPNDILLTKQTAQWQETMDTPEKSEAPSDPADPTLGDSQKLSDLKKKMSRIAKVFAKLSM